MGGGAYDETSITFFFLVFLQYTITPQYLISYRNFFYIFIIGRQGFLELYTVQCTVKRQEINASISLWGLDSDCQLILKEKKKWNEAATLI
jgi:hypothetical protein